MANENDLEQLEAPEVLSKRLLSAIDDAPDGHLKRASDASSQMIRRRIRENGFQRLILPFKQISDSDLTQLPDTDRPAIVEEMEPDSPGAKSISFNDSADTDFFRGDKFVVFFSKITTPEFTKNIDELRTYRYDLRGIVTDNALKDVHTEEDARFIATCDEIVGGSGEGEVGESGLQQNFDIQGDITRANYVELLSHLEDRDLNNGSFLLNRKTAKKFLKWTRDEIGGDLAQDLFKDGLSALKEFKIMGVRHIATIKRDLVPDDVVYQFAEPGYLGKAYVLQDITMYVEKKKDILRFSAMEKIGVALANVAALNRSKFHP